MYTTFLNRSPDPANAGVQATNGEQKNAWFRCISVDSEWTIKLGKIVCKLTNYAIFAYLWVGGKVKVVK